MDERTRYALETADTSLLVGLVVLIIGALLVGCGGGAIQLHAGAIVTTSGVHSVAGASIDAARTAELERVAAEHPTAGPERVEAVRSAARLWEPVGAALDGVRTALITWAESVELARLADAGDELLASLLPLAARVVQLWADVVRLAASLDVELPALPSSVTTVADSLGAH